MIRPRTAGQISVAELIGEDEELRAAFKKAEQAGRQAYRAGDKEGAAAAKAEMKKMIMDAYAKYRAEKVKIEAEKQIKEETMNKLNDYFTMLNDVPLKLIMKVSLKWAIGLLPFALFVLLFLGLLHGLYRE